MNAQARPSAGPPLVSIVVITYNRASMLPATVASLRRLQTDERFTYEIVVVNNASSDNTAQVLHHAAQQSGAPVKPFLETRPGVSCARNAGIAHAQGEWIAFHDDDQLADPRWLVELFGLAHRRGVRVVGGAVRLKLPEAEQRQLAPQCRKLLGETVGSVAEQPYGRKDGFGAGSLLIHRDVFAHVGRFDESLTEGGEDTDLYRRVCAAGIDCWFCPASVVHHVIPSERLADQYMRWSALRSGRLIAKWEAANGARSRWGMAVGRTGQALLNYLPRYIAARLAGDRERALGARCLLWRSQGYLQTAAPLLGDASARGASRRPSLNFRDRPEPAGQSPTPPASTPAVLLPKQGG